MYLVFSVAILVTATDSSTSRPDEHSPRPLYEINRHIRSLCQRDSLAKTDQDRAAAAVEMTQVYYEIRTDPRYVTSDTLKEYRARLWSRLTRIKKDIETRLRRERGQGKARNVPLGEPSDATVAMTTQSLGDQLALMAAGMGGPAGVFSQAGAAGGGTVSDYGPDLVALIQRTIQPDFWDIYGGPGTIVYYRPLHCLVVRATSEVHHRLGGTLTDLRSAGK